MLGPHYKSPKPGKAWVRFSIKPDKACQELAQKNYFSSAGFKSKLWLDTQNLIEIDILCSRLSDI